MEYRERRRAHAGRRDNDRAWIFGLDGTWRALRASTRPIGWSTTTLPDATAASYAREVDALTKAITAHRRAEATVTGGGRTSSNNGKAAVCGCGRKIRASIAVIDAGPILCGLCGSEFEPEEE
ncbi:MAG: hypothetical protein ACK5IN_03380 [Microbacterium sp.]|uniref:hypothetical protein n=1 Tax=Microbacterium sp. TaxID=51671 RepID=UPI003A892B7C